MTLDKNPLLQDFNTPFNTPPFNLIKEAHYLPAIKEGIKQGEAEIETIVTNQEAPSFKNTILAMEQGGDIVTRVSEIFFNLNSAETNDEIQKLAQEISPLLTDYANQISLNQDLFKRVKHVWENRDNENLNPEESKLLEKTFKSFSRNGALLDPTKKEELKEINKDLALTALNFGENVLAETNKYLLEITDENLLDGLPDFALEAASATAKEK